MRLLFLRLTAGAVTGIVPAGLLALSRSSSARFVLLNAFRARLERLPAEAGEHGVARHA